MQRLYSIHLFKFYIPINHRFDHIIFISINIQKEPRTQSEWTVYMPGVLQRKIAIHWRVEVQYFLRSILEDGDKYVIISSRQQNEITNLFFFVGQN